MTDLVVVTALLGNGPDRLGPSPPAVEGVRYVCVTDRQDALPPGWERQAYTGPFIQSSRLQARWVRAFLVTAFPESPTLWIDASFDIKVSPLRFLDVCLSRDVEMLAFRHHDRHRMRDEAAELVRLGQISALEAQQFIAAYQVVGWDTDAEPQRVLTAGGMLLRRDTERTRAFGLRWWVELYKWGERFDQLSLDYCAAQVGLTIGHLSKPYAAHPWLHYDRQRHRGLVSK